MSLAEVAVSSLLVGILAIGAMETVGAVFKTRGRAIQRSDGFALAQLLIAEIARCPYRDAEEPDAALGLDTGESAPRSNFDDVDDYHGWDASPPVDAAGVALPTYNGWRREVSVSYVDPGTLNPSGAETGLKRITVRVTSPRQEQTEVSTLCSEDGVGGQDRARSATAVGWVGCELQIGSGGTRVVKGTNLVHYPDQG